MKIGILTFHWAVNHGAILQTYATTKYLTSKGHNVEIVDYFPKERELNFKTLFRPHYPRVMLERVPLLLKEKRLSHFRNQLPLSKRYYTNQELIDSPPHIDLLLCGSDQIWNPSYALYGEGGITPVYFANFGKFKKAALSVSFGCGKYPKNAELAVKKYICNFDYISVREKSGISILEDMGVSNTLLTPDPTSLLEAEQYLEICKKIPKNNNNNVALCVLRKQNRKTCKLIKALCDKTKIRKINNIKHKSMEKWLAGIRDANIVITNSFHCVMMCLKFHKPFWVVLENGALSGMNDRMFTLLEKVGLEDRIVSDTIITTPKEIDWSIVDTMMDSYAQTLKEYLLGVTNQDYQHKLKIQCYNKENEINHIGAYAVKANDNNIRLASSSGGVFSLLARKIIESGGVVFGAAFTDDFKSVKHIGVTMVEDLEKLRGSKYVESDIKDVYTEVLEALNCKKQVLFTGTPCQIGALKAFLKIDYDNLICQDVVCHGAPIKKVWRSYAEYLEKKAKSRLCGVGFRNKDNGWRNYRIKYIFENGKSLSINSSYDLYMRGFLSNLYLKPSCYNCAFKGNNSVSDITLADFWGIEKLCPEFDDNLGASLVLIKSDKGKQIFNDISNLIRFVEIPLNDALIYNTSMLCSAQKNDHRDEFIKEINDISINKALKKYCKISIKSKIIKIFKIIYKKNCVK